jgi:FAD/FMN-containing dehydrogenase
MFEVTQRPPCEPLVPPGGFELLARDMTATFSADCTLRVVQDKLNEIGQWLPVDGDADATLGSLVEINSTGPLRLGFGGWRDLLLGAQFTNGRGELITAGGKTVKNVAGYDLTKFMVGGHGIFGRLVSITTRTHRRPDGALLARRAPDAAKLAAMIPTPMRPQWALLSVESLLCGYLADETTLDWYESQLRADSSVTVERRSLEDDIAHRASLWKSGETGTSFRAAIPPRRLAEFVASIFTKSWVAEPAFGVVIGDVPDDSAKQSLRDSANSLGGAVRFGSGATGDLDVSTNPLERQIIERLKSAFDPDNRLAPLPWQQ